MRARVATSIGALAVAACATDVAGKPVVGCVSALPTIQHPADKPSTPAKVALGAQLFMDKRLSGSGTNNCQS